MCIAASGCIQVKATNTRIGEVYLKLILNFLCAKAGEGELAMTTSRAFLREFGLVAAVVAFQKIAVFVVRKTNIAVDTF